MGGDDSSRRRPMIMAMSWLPTTSRLRTEYSIEYLQIINDDPSVPMAAAWLWKLYMCY